MNYEDLQVSAAPAWLSGRWGTAWNRTLGWIKDQVLDVAKVAVKLRFPALAHPDALAHLADDRSLLPRWDEDDTAFRARIGRVWRTWLWAGTKRGLLAELNAAGYANVTIFEAVDFEVPVASWNRFWVVIGAPFKTPGALADGVWGDPGSWGDGGSWAFDLPDREKAHIRAIIRKWSPAHARCDGVAVFFGRGRLWDFPAPVCAWGAPSPPTFGAGADAPLVSTFGV